MKTVYPILRQIVNLIPPNIFHQVVASTKDLSREFSPWSHVVALVYQQFLYLQGFLTFSLASLGQQGAKSVDYWGSDRPFCPPRKSRPIGAGPRSLNARIGV